MQPDNTNSDGLGGTSIAQVPLTPKTSISEHSKYDSSFTPSQSPMVKITETLDEGDDTAFGSPSLPGSLPHLSKRRASQYMSPKIPLQTDSFYNLEGQNSSSSLVIAGGNIPGNRSSISSLKYIPPPSLPIRNRSPSRAKSPVRSRSPIRSRSSSPKKYQPFNFRSTNLSNPSFNNSRASHRKGHKYKHSSVSMNFFQEPKHRAPLNIPASYPIPNFNEFLSSCSSLQKRKLIWALFHFSMSFIIFLVGFNYSISSFTTLSHLIFYDSLGSLALICVDIMSNFDVWSKSSIKYPFGLGRIQVLFEFSLSVSLIFVGCDLISHFFEEFIASFFNNVQKHDHQSGHNHHNTSSHPALSLIWYELYVLLTITATLISSKLTHGNVKDSKVVIKKLRLVTTGYLNHPTHLITMVFALYSAVYPLILSLKSEFRANEISTLLISLLICYIGWKIVKYLGFIIILSYPGADSKINNKSSKIKDEILSLPSFKSSYKINDLVISQIHLNLSVVFLNLTMVGCSDDDENNLRDQIDKILKRKVTSNHVESTIDIDRF